MLVLTRKQGEEVLIDGNIRVSVVGLSGGRVKIGIMAPDEVLIRRGELPSKTSSPGDHPLRQQPGTKPR